MTEHIHGCTTCSRAGPGTEIRRTCGNDTKITSLRDTVIYNHTYRKWCRHHAQSMLHCEVVNGLPATINPPLLELSVLKLPVCFLDSFTET